MGWLAHLGRDVRLALRAIRRMPIVALVVIGSIGVGIGVNVTVFSWLQAFVFQPLPGVANISRMYLVEPRAEAGTYPGGSWLEFGDLRKQLPSFDDVLAFRMTPFNLGEAGRTERTFGLLVSGNYFSELGLQPALGRFLQPDEVSKPGAAPAVVISYDFWQARFASQPSAIGQILRVNDRPLTVVGVTPEGFQGTVVAVKFDLFVPATMAPVLLAGSRELDERGYRGYSMMGRLRPDADVAQAQAQLDGAMRELAREYPSSNATMRGEIMPFSQAPRGPQRMLAGALELLQAIMLTLLLAVCGNTANLVLARASTRHREVGVRIALGAGPRRIFSLLLTENLVLALAGAGLGVALAMWGTQALRAVPMIGSVPIKLVTHVDATAMAFALLLGLVSGAAFGLAPAVQLGRVDPLQALRSGARSAGRSGLRHALMGVQIALASLILLVAGMFYRSFSETREADPGFRREGVLLGAYDFSGRNPSEQDSRSFAARLLDRLRALPGVEVAAIASSVPLDIHGMPLRSFALEGRARNDASDDQALVNTVTPGYLQTMSIPLVSGADFADLNDPAAPPQAIVNEAFVHRYLPDAQPLARRLQVRDTTFVIVGVARDSLYESFGEPPTPLIYFSYRDRPSSRGEIHVRTRPGAEAPLGAEIQRVVRDLDPMLPVYDVRTLGDHVEKNLFLRRIPARMFVVLGPLLLALAAVGIYAVIAHAVSQRTQEIGIRMSLGATARRIERDIVGESMRVIVVGALVGWVIALGLAIHLASTGPIDLAVFVGIPLALLLVAAAACWWPARRAAEVSPMRALRQD
ncbi:MAG TPA: ABC transporter permease [Vicinamibacterales bacterium]|nr:ABC transporter permease [Vicinamibacterales bacterium]